VGIVGIIAVEDIYQLIAVVQMFAVCRHIFDGSPFIFIQVGYRDIITVGVPGFDQRVAGGMPLLREYSFVCEDHQKYDGIFHKLGF